MRTRLHFSNAYHLQTNGQSSWTIQRLEDILRAFVIDFCGIWNSYLPLDEFSHNNNYHYSIVVLLLELLHWRKFPTQVCWGGGGRSQGYREDEGGPSNNRAHPTYQTKIADNSEPSKELYQQTTFRVRVSGCEYSFTEFIPLKGCITLQEEGKFGALVYWTIRSDG